MPLATQDGAPVHQEEISNSEGAGEAGDTAKRMRG